ncbi:MAG TPA: molybdopterin oxidoreductase, partial [Dehalococcoidia bacterium]|nr:molybdopterin oxidoreductase [Dehalococcoidia bacterium]
MSKGNVNKVTRREFIKSAAFLGGTGVVVGSMPWILDGRGGAPGRIINPNQEYELAKAENIIYTVCQQCNTQCGIKAKLYDGILVKIDGNPFSPWNLQPHLPYKTSVFDTTTIDGFLCSKGQASIQTAYDPYRVVKVLKRAGKRGENRWQTIPFEQAVGEIVSGGKLFAHVPGEENRAVTGLKELWAVRDP